MQKASLEDDAPVSSREATNSSSRSNVLDNLPDERTEGRNKSEDSSSPDDVASKTSLGGGEAKKPHAAGLKNFASEFPDEEMLDTDFFLKKETATPKEFQKENTPQHHITGPKTLKLKEAPSYFGSDFPDKKMPDSGVLSNKEAPTPEKFEEENQTLNLAG